MDSTVAKRLLIEGGTFVALDVPEGTEFGIDMKSWTTGENFRGVKMIPAGIHFIHYSAVGKYGELSPKVGFFYNFKKSEFVIKKWDKNKQDLSVDPVDQTEVVGLKDNMMMLDKFLGPYPYDIWKKWVLLTSHVTENIMKKLAPESGQIRSALDLESCSDADRPRKSKRQSELQSTSEDMEDNLPSDSSPSSRRRSRASTSEDIENNLLPDLKPFPGTELRLTPFPKQNYPEGSTPAEITQHSLDSTYALETMISQHTNETDLVGELQFSYICFLVGHSLEAFEHWKKLVSLLCSCEAAIKKYRTIYDLFICTLEAQILETPEDFLADIVSNNNIVYVKLRDLFRTVQGSDIEGRLKTKIERFKRNLTSRYEWDFSHLDSEDDDEAPVVVDIS